MAVKEIKDYSAVSSPAAGDKFVTQQAADSITRYATITQIISVFKAAASGLASLNSSTKVVEQPASISDHLDDTAGGTNAATTKAPTSNVMYDHGVATTGVHGAGSGTICTEETADTKDTDAIAAHAAEDDPHAGYRLESADHDHSATGAQGGQIGAAATTALFGAWASKSNNTSYLAETDGFVTAYSTGEDDIVKIFTDSSNPPTTQRSNSRGQSSTPTGADGQMLVRKGDYWKVTGADYVFWLPVGS